MTDWPHAPVHKLNEQGIYMVTCGTYRKKHVLNDARQLDLVQNMLFVHAEEYKWQLQAWAVFSNHYHFIGLFPDNPESLRPMLSELHRKSRGIGVTLTVKSIQKGTYSCPDLAIMYVISLTAFFNFRFESLLTLKKIWVIVSY